MRVIINEIQIRQKNFDDKSKKNYVEVNREGTESIASKLTSKKAKSWIKTSLNGKGYSERQMERFKMQEENPDVFAKTKIINNNLVKIEHISVIGKSYQYNVLSQINFTIKKNNLDVSDFRELIKSFYQKDEIIEPYYVLLEIFEKKDDKFSKKLLIDMKNLFKKFRLFLKKYNLNVYDFYDLHIDNWGYNKQGKLKILDW